MRAMSYRRKHDRTHPRGWFSLFLRLGGWVCLVAAAGLLLLTLFSEISLRLADRLDAEAGYAWATITGKTALGDADDPDSYLVSFTYKRRGQGGLTAQAEVSEAFFSGARVGDERAIRYVLDDPGQIELEPGQHRRAGRILRYAALGLGLIGLIALWRLGQQTNRAILARRQGDKRLAKVTAIRDAGVEVNDAPMGRLVWLEPDGMTGESLMRGLDELRGTYRIGDEIVVFRRGRDAVWEGDVGPPWREVGG